MAHLLAVAAACGTSIGRREDNQDACWASEIPNGGGDPSAPRFLLAVADGTGGHAEGALASRTAVETISAHAASWEACRSEAQARHAVERAFQEINAALYSRGQTTGQKTCTTLTAAVVLGARMVVGHVGDSRAYLVRGGRTWRLTRDDTWVEQQKQLGRMSPRDAGESHYRGIITQALGSRPTIQVHHYAHDLADGDCLLVCTDGLYNGVQDGQIASILETHDDPQGACDELLALALSRDGTDNATAVVACIGTRAARRSTRKVRLVGALMLWWRVRMRLGRWLVLLLVLAVLGGACAMWLTRGSGSKVLPRDTLGSKIRSIVSPKRTRSMSERRGGPVTTSVAVHHRSAPAVSSKGEVVPAVARRRVTHLERMTTRPAAAKPRPKVSGVESPEEPKPGRSSFQGTGGQR